MTIDRELRAGLPISILAVTSAMLLAGPALSDDQCTGHRLLTTPRSETSCQSLVLQIIVSPDQTIHAVLYPSAVTLYATPDMENRIVFRSSAGTTLTSQDYSSPRGTDGYYVFFGQWSPDSQYFAFSLSSSGGHSPWSFPIKVYGVKQNQIANFSDMINGNPTVSGQFQFSGPHTLIASTWKQPGDTGDAVPVSVDLEAAFAKVKPSAN